MGRGSTHSVVPLQETVELTGPLSSGLRVTQAGSWALTPGHR